MFVVAGITGRTGRVVAQTLKNAGKEVRGLLREGESAGSWSTGEIELRTIPSLADAAALTRAFEGAEGAYVLLPTDVRSQAFLEEARQLEDAIGTAIEQSGLPHVVHLSSIGAHHSKGTGPIRALHYAEERLARTGARVTVVRAGLFIENWAVFAAATKAGKLPTFTPPTLVHPTVGTEDIGRVAARALLEGPSRSKAVEVIELSGPRDLSPNDIAQIFGTLLGKDVVAEQAPLDVLVPTFTSYGFSKDVSELYAELYAGLAAGIVAFEGGGARAIRGDVDAAEILRAFV